MLQRVLESEVMDSLAEADDYDSMDHRAVNQAFVRDFLAHWDGRGPILDVGTGTAQIPIEFCRQSFEGQVTAIDLAESMLAIGRRNVEAAGLSDRITLEKVNGREMPYGSCTFAAVISNSIIHHIPEPCSAFGEMTRVVCPGATLFVRDLLRPHDESTLERLVEVYAAGANAHQRQMFHDSLHAALSLDEVRNMVASFNFCPTTVQQTSDRHWTWIARKP